MKFLTKEWSRQMSKKGFLLSAATFPIKFRCFFCAS